MTTQQGSDTTESLNYQTWVLRVPIHCKGCKKKVHKILHNVDGVFTVSVDSQQHKVSVTGNIEAEKLVKILAKAGKHAEILHENSGDGDSENKTGKSKKNDQGSGEKAKVDEDDNQGNNSEEKDEGNPLKNNVKKDAANEKLNLTNDGGEKKDTGKGANDEGHANTESLTSLEAINPSFGTNMMHFASPYGHMYSFPAPYYPTQAFGQSYSTAHPSNTSSSYALPAFGQSYSTAHPSNTSSSYALPAFGHDQSYGRYLQAPLSDAIYSYNRNHHDEVYVYNDNEDSCSIM